MVNILTINDYTLFISEIPWECQKGRPVRDRPFLGGLFRAYLELFKEELLLLCYKLSKSCDLLID
jgi:hypothetical protein